jgi:hypothetical protein
LQNQVLATNPDEEFMIQENEDEIGPIDDEDGIADLNNLNIIDNLQGQEFGDYDAGEEPEDSDSQKSVDECGDFEEDEEGEEESDDETMKRDKQKQDSFGQGGFNLKSNVPDEQSKNSTACTNGGEQALLKVQQISSAENKISKRKISMKTKKNVKAPKVKDDF